MSILTIHQGPQVKHVVFDRPTLLSALLQQADLSLAQPCGGRGACGKCAVLLTGDVSAPNGAEQRCGVRLSCQAIIQGDAEMTLPTPLSMTQIAGGSRRSLLPLHPMKGSIGAAVDIGTTTLALLLYDLCTGHCIGAASMLNPQTSVAADVIGRIDAAMKDQSDHLRQQIENAISTLLTSACAEAECSANDVHSMVVTGNTTMLYLLTGRNPASLSRAPFLADHLFGADTSLLNRRIYLPDCMHAFVGADTTCALLASKMMEREATALLCDVGTNGELALWHHGKLYISSTAAGPAFEGAGISCGCGSIPGAIDRVEVLNGGIKCHTIDDQSAIGLCGSGLVDAIAAMLDTEVLDETGLLEDDVFPLAGSVTLTQADIRSVQLAKAATNAGVMSLLAAAHCPVEAVETVYLAGGFGSHLNLRSAARIGLIPADLADRVHVLGNAALDGAAMLLMDTSKRANVSAMRDMAQHIRLDGNPDFANRYVEAMLFPEE